MFKQPLWYVSHDAKCLNRLLKQQPHRHNWRQKRRATIQAKNGWQQIVVDLAQRSNAWLLTNYEHLEAVGSSVQDALADQQGFKGRSLTFNLGTPLLERICPTVNSLVISTDQHPQAKSIVTQLPSEKFSFSRGTGWLSNCTHSFHFMNLSSMILNLLMPYCDRIFCETKTTFRQRLNICCFGQLWNTWRNLPLKFIGVGNIRLQIWFKSTYMSLENGCLVSRQTFSDRQLK